MQLSIKKIMVLTVLSIYFGLFAQSVPSIPTLDKPFNYSTNIPINVILYWYDQYDADSYNVEVSDNVAFTTTIFSQNNITGTYIQVSPNLNSSTTYYWHVEAVNTSGSSGWSAAWSFTTGNGNLPDIPLLSSPYNGTTDIPTGYVNFNWNYANYSDSYTLQISTDPNFISPIFYEESGIGYYSKTVAIYSQSTTHYWRVSAQNSYGSGDWSQVWNFTTTGDNKPPMTPQLIGPYNWDNSIPTDITLFWEKSPGATSYDVQVATDYNFSSPYPNETGIQKESYKVNGMSSDIDYYWRIRAVNDNGPSEWSDYWQFHTRTGSDNPTEPILIGPGNEDSELPVDLTFTWEYARGADNYTLQVSTTQDFTNIILNAYNIEANCYKVTGTELGYNTDYYWCVKANNNNGESRWSETKHFTTGSYDEVPDYPQLIGPYNSDYNLPVDLTLVWDYVRGADHYRLQISRDYSFYDIVYDEGGIIFPRRKVYGLDYNQTYYWKVMASNSHGGGSWSTVWNFQTSSGYPAPDTPYLVQPYNNETGYPSYGYFQWNYAKGADCYNLQIATDYNFYNRVYEESGIPNTTRSVKLDGYTTYCWRIQAVNQNGPSSWSDTYMFTTGEDQSGQDDNGPPLLYAPYNCQTGVPTDVTLFWLQDESITSFDVEISSDPYFNYIEGSQYGIDSRFYTFTGLYSNHVYYWHARTSMNSVPSNWSESWCFITGDGTRPPSAPKLFGPRSDAYDLPADVTLFWEYANGAQSYQLQVSSTYEFDDIVYDESGLELTWEKVYGLSYGGTYYWRVRGYNNDGDGNWSEIWNLNIGSGYSYPEPPSLIKPVYDDSGLPTFCRFKWDYGKGADYYRLEISTDPSFYSTYTSIDELPLHFMVSGGLETNRTYYWRIKSVNDIGESNWSDTWQFSTWDGYSYPSAPSLISPDNNINIISTNIVLEWERSWGAESYRLQVATDYNFNDYDIVYDESNIMTTKRAVSLPYTDHRYYWQVQAGNRISSSYWSGYWEFYIENYPEYVYLSQDYYFPEQPETHNYQIIGIPGNDGISLEDILGQGGQNQSWDAYWDNGADGSPEQYLERFDPYNSNFNCEVGRAFWVIADHNFTVDRNFQSAPANSGYALIDLHYGWNLITNPFDFEVYWDDIIQANSMYGNETIWEFNEGFDTTDRMYPGYGYYFDNQGNLDQLRIPYYQNGSMGKASINNDIEWELNISLFVDDLKDISTSLGVARGAAKQKDSFDLRKPRAVGELPSVYFEREKWKHYSGTYARDMRAPIDTIEIWDFNVNIMNYRNARLSFDGINDIPEIFEVYLIDKERSKFVDLRKQSSYDFQAVKSKSSFELCVGKKESVDEELKQYLPKEYRLAQNYPNPFNPVTMIPFSLPDESEISLIVFNILGQEVRTLYQGKMDAGIHYIPFNSRDQYGNRLSSGLYFYRLITDKGHNFVKKMILIK